jgi:hypothetical protein
MSFDSLDDTQIEKKFTKETVENAEEKLFGKYQQLSNLRDENIRLGNTELDTETLHGLQEAYLIANHMNWLKSLQKTYKATKRYRSAIIKKNKFYFENSPEVLLTITRKTFSDTEFEFYQYTPY